MTVKMILKLGGFGLPFFRRFFRKDMGNAVRHEAA